MADEHRVVDGNGQLDVTRMARAAVALQVACRAPGSQHQQSALTLAKRTDCTRDRTMLLMRDHTDPQVLDG